VSPRLPSRPPTPPQAAAVIGGLGPPPPRLPALPSAPTASGALRCEILYGVARGADGEFGLAVKAFAFSGSVPAGQRMWTSGLVQAPDSVLAAEAAAALVGLSLLPSGCTAHLCLGDRRLVDLFLSGVPLGRFGVPDGLRALFAQLSRGKSIVLDLVGHRETPGLDGLVEEAQTAARKGAALRWCELVAMLEGENGSGSSWCAPKTATTWSRPISRRRVGETGAPPG